MSVLTNLNATWTCAEGTLHLNAGPACDHGHTNPKYAAAAVLLPCPFCGEAVALNSPYLHWVACGACAAEGPTGDTAAEAVAAWNKRVKLSAATTTNETGEV